MDPGSEAGSRMAEMLIVNPTLTTISLSTLNLDADNVVSIANEGLAQLVGALARNSEIKMLEICP